MTFSVLRPGSGAVRLVVAWIACLGAVEAGAEPARVRWDGGLLSVDAHRANRADLLRAVARQTNTDIAGLQQATGDVTLRITAVPLDDALKMIADDGGFALVRREVRGHARYVLYLVGNGTAASGRGSVAPAIGLQPRVADPPSRAGMPVPPPATPPSIPRGGSVTVTDEGG